MGKNKDEGSTTTKRRKISSDQELMIPFNSAESIEVIVSGFPTKITKEQVQKLFKSCGEFSVSIPSPCQGIVFLKFTSEKSSKKALKLNNGSYKGNTLLINKVSDLPKVQKDKQAVTSVFVGSIKDGTTEAQLQSFFSGAGKIKSIRMNAEKAYAHIDFTNRHSAELAEKLIGAKLNGQKIKIEIADKKK